VRKPTTRELRKPASSVLGSTPTRLDLTALAPPSALVLDLDGTLVDTVGLRIQAWSRALASNGLPVGRDRISPLIGMDGRLLVGEVAASVGTAVTDEKAEEIDREAGRIYDGLNADPRPLSGAAILLALLTERGIPWAIATSSRAAQARVSIAALRLGTEPFVVDDDGGDQGKPAPDLLLRAAERLRVTAQRCWCIGDSIWDMRAARAAGMTGIGVTTGAVSGTALLRAGAAAVVPSLDVLAESLVAYLGRATALLRATRPSDLTYVVALERDPSAARFIDQWAAHRHVAAIEDPDLQHFIVESNGERIGFIIAGLVERGDIELRRLVVGPKGRGHGRAALTAFLQWAHARLVGRKHRVWLDVYSDNHRAIRLYQSAGFHATGVETARANRRLIIMDWTASSDLESKRAGGQAGTT
jgi:beta-phosphoglucomutase-like phosphatase (HAD superfamily)/ribosomal protein S18 acetylase RimI-like enzyme